MRIAIRTIIVGACLLLLFTLIVHYYLSWGQSPTVPALGEKWWGPGHPLNDTNSSIEKFVISASEKELKELKQKLNQTRPLHPPLEGANQHYGINTDLLNTVLLYWNSRYNWTDRVGYLNRFPQYTTRIQGLKIHFIHVGPQNVTEGVEIVPLLLIHGWPSSVSEFYEIIPILTTLQEGRNFVFQVVAPSLPGYAFSEGSVRPGLNVAEIAVIFNTLMKRLGFNRYYVHGGDWGSLISHDMAVLFPENVIGLHRNWCMTFTLFSWKTYVGIFFPSLFFSPLEIEHIYPLSENLQFLWVESGYFHLQATKPDTIGVALRDSPAGLAAYILEKVITGTNPAWKDLPDGGLTRKFTLDELLDNVMIYWITGSISSANRLYAETFSWRYNELGVYNMPVEVPAACSRFGHEIFFSPETILRTMHKQLLHVADYTDIGHFAAAEAPETMAEDVMEFVTKVRNKPQAVYQADL